MSQIENKINLILQLLIKIGKETIGEKAVKELCDDYGHWEDSTEFRSGEHRNV